MVDGDGLIADPAGRSQMAAVLEAVAAYVAHQRGDRVGCDSAFGAEASKVHTD
jgi:hypothetical protein